MPEDTKIFLAKLLVWHKNNFIKSSEDVQTLDLQIALEHVFGGDIIVDFEQTVIYKKDLVGKYRDIREWALK